MTDPITINQTQSAAVGGWVRPSRCANGACVEVRLAGDRVEVRALGGEFALAELLEASRG